MSKGFYDIIITFKSKDINNHTNNHTKFGYDISSGFGVQEVRINESTILITRYNY
jgi:hypothetical protein